MPEPINVSEAFQKQLTEWEKKFQRSVSTSETTQANIRGLEALVRYLQLPIEPGFKRKGFRPTPGRPVEGVPVDIAGAIFAEGKRFSQGQAERTASQIEAGVVSGQIKQASLDLLKSVFYTDLYGIVPSLVASGAVNSPDEALSLLSVPPDLTPVELVSVRNEISQLLSARASGMPTEEEIPELAREEIELPELQPPPEKRLLPISIHQISTQALLKSLTTPKIPESTMSVEEWHEYLKSKGWSEDDIDNEVQITTERLIAEAQNRKNMIESYRNEGAKIPDLTLLDVVKMSIINPPLAVLEGLNIYYEHVSMPAAGWLYGFIPDIQVAYNNFKNQNPNATEREAWVYAWKKWEAPGPPVLDFILKYMLMEGLVDPLSYVGWGFVTKGLRALGPAGRIAAAGNRAVGEVLELPFDLIKWTTKSVIPKTVSQRAAVMSREALSELDRFFELYTKKPLSFIQPKKIYEASEYALNHLAKNPRAEDDIAMAARSILVHPPVSRKEVTGWAARLRRTGAGVIDDATITENTLLDIDTIFERVFDKEITVDEAAPLLLHKFGASNITEDVSVLAGRFLADRANTIYSRALDFATEKTANRAMREYARKSLKVFEAQLASEEFTAAQKSGRFAIFTYNVDKNRIQPWAQQINRFVIRPAAEAYLTFGMYGPMNTIEDIWRSIVGGVKAGRVTLEQYDTITMGLRGDPELRRAGISEMIGPLRETGDPARTNWILTMSLTPLSVPTYLATRGKITPRQFAKGAFRNLVELFGGVGQDIRRNFVAGRYQQILGETGGEAFTALRNAVPKDLPSELASAPKWVKRNLRKELENAATTGKLTTDNVELVTALKNRYTRDRILRTEVDSILQKYGDISPSARSMIMDGFDEKMLFGEETSRGVPVKIRQKALVKSAADAEELTSRLNAVAGKLSTGKDFAPSLSDAIKRWNKHPEDDLLQLVGNTASVSREYKESVLDALRERYPLGYIKVYRGHGQAGSSTQALKREFINVTSSENVAKEFGATKWLTPEGSEDFVVITLDDVVAIGNVGESELVVTSETLINRLKNPLAPVKEVVDQSSINDFMRTVMDAEVDDFLRGPERATAQYDQLTQLLTSLEVKNPEDMAELIVSLHRMTATYGALPDQIMARATVKSRGLPLNDRKLQFDAEFDRLQTFIEKAGADIDKVVDFIKAKDIGTVPYKSATQRYLDLATSARQTMAAAKSRDIAFRSSYFADATQKDLRDPAFWNSFYASETAHWKSVNKQLAVVNSQLHQAINDINLASGLKMPVRAPVKVIGRELAPADVAKLMSTRGDDLSRMLLDTLIPEGDKDYFVEYIMGLVKEGDEGFTREAIGNVYDQIAASIQVDPSSTSWFRVRQKQIESMTRDFHDLYNAKLFPKEQKIAVDKFIDDTVSNIGDVRARTDLNFENYDQLRQSSLDEANKWYYKEYTDYTNANAVDAIMKQFYPFWTYESQRWFWLPHSFVRRPGTLTAWGRWENNTDYGYIHIPGTAIDINLARGTVYGPWSTRLMRRDYPEYYDELEGMGGLVGFFDWVSRYGFYPNAIFGVAQAQFGGATGQLGGVLPSIASTPLNALIAAFPDNPLVSFISERVFPENFRQYLTARRVDDLGGDGSLLFAKMQTGQKLTEDEEVMWADSRRSVALHSAAFEQLGFARMRSDQAYELAEASTQFIEEQYGFTKEQQRQLRLRGEKLWDLIGGLDPWETAVLQELEFFKYSGSINPVLPSHQQEILNKVEIDWADVMSYSESQVAEILTLQQDFLTGSERGRLSPDDFLYRVRDLYRKRRDYIDGKTKANPLMLLENRTEYYEKYGQLMPVQSPYNELMDLFFSIELEDVVEPGTGARILDWDKFFANREMISAAIPADDKAKWDTFLSRHTAPMMQVWRDVYNTYFKKYYQLWDKVLSTYSADEQTLINEYLFLENTGQQLDRQTLIKDMVSQKDGKQLISSFRSGVSNERETLRFANPHLDAWLFYWGRVSSFKTSKSEQVYKELARQTGRKI